MNHPRPSKPPSGTPQISSKSRCYLHLDVYPGATPWDEPKYASIFLSIKSARSMQHPLHRLQSKKNPLITIVTTDGGCKDLGREPRIKQPGVCHVPGRRRAGKGDRALALKEIPICQQSRPAKRQNPNIRKILRKLKERGNYFWFLGAERKAQNKESTGRSNEE